jgi:hypothetical protein
LVEGPSFFAETSARKTFDGAAGEGVGSAALADVATASATKRIIRVTA